MPRSSVVRISRSRPGQRDRTTGCSARKNSSPRDLAQSTGVAVEPDDALDRLVVAEERERRDQRAGADAGDDVELRPGHVARTRPQPFSTPAPNAPQSPPPEMTRTSIDGRAPRPGPTSGDRPGLRRRLRSSTRLPARSSGCGRPRARAAFQVARSFVPAARPRGAAHEPRVKADGQKGLTNGPSCSGRAAMRRSRRGGILRLASWGEES